MISSTASSSLAPSQCTCLPVWVTKLPAGIGTVPLSGSNFGPESYGDSALNSDGRWQRVECTVTVTRAAIGTAAPEDLLTRKQDKLRTERDRLIGEGRRKYPGTDKVNNETPAARRC